MRPRNPCPVRLINATACVLRHALPDLTDQQTERLSRSITEALLRELCPVLVNEFVANTDDDSGAAEHHFGLIAAFVNDLANAVDTGEPGHARGCACRAETVSAENLAGYWKERYREAALALRGVDGIPRTWEAS